MAARWVSKEAIKLPRELLPCLCLFYDTTMPFESPLWAVTLLARDSKWLRRGVTVVELRLYDGRWLARKTRGILYEESTRASISTTIRGEEKYVSIWSRVTHDRSANVVLISASKSTHYIKQQYIRIVATSSCRRCERESSCTNGSLIITSPLQNNRARFIARVRN